MIRVIILLVLSLSAANAADRLTGQASFYHQPQRSATAYPEYGRYDENALKAAHYSLPGGSKVRVTNLRNDRSVDVVINDRGPFSSRYATAPSYRKVIDLTPAAAAQIGLTRRQGVTPVKLIVLERGTRVPRSRRH